MTLKTVNIKITGIVQGVGFRPFLYNLAKEFELNGYILNRGNAGVRLVLQGPSEKIDTFIKTIEKRRPRISYIEKIEVNPISNDIKFMDLEIKKSEKGKGISLTLPPDIAICEDCLQDMKNNANNRYYMYPFTACAVCGPRFTTVIELPYDRERTTMRKFPFCEDCQKEYENFNNRRFHAQTFACSRCGPRYSLHDKNRKLIESEKIDKILTRTSQLIKEGNVIAIKGIGGVHLACLATEDHVILKLRKQKGERKYKPFALMVPNLKIIDKFFYISEKERELLESFRRPIVLLEKRENFSDSGISELVAPGLNNIGFMLPYSGIHHLLFDFVGPIPLVYTSGNKSNIPMALKNELIFNQLQDLADYFLLHDRKIYQRADDSVLRIHDNKIKLIRRSRGFVPEYFPLPFHVSIPGALATGPELAVTGAVLRRNRIFPTQHIGNVTHLETHEFLKEALFHMKRLLQIKEEEIKFIACDAHPNFFTTKLAEELASKRDIPLFRVQHHHAHVLALMAENNIELDEKIIGISTDGVGYGEDGNIWGGELLSCTYRSHERLGHLEYQPMIGGDRCTKYPARMTASVLLNALDMDETVRVCKEIQLYKDLEYGHQELSIIIKQFENQQENNEFKAFPLTSSTGRIFDVVSYLLGAARIKTYRGEPAMRLEGLATRGIPGKVKLNLSIENIKNKLVLKTSDLILDIINLLQSRKYSKEDIALAFHLAIARAFAEGAMQLAKQHGIEKIGLTGGVAYNHAFSATIKKFVQENGFIFLEHDKIPPGDAGISTGQLIHGIFQYQDDK